MLMDYHVHTAYSDDSNYLMEDVVKDAIEKGLKELCFCDHIDYGIKQDPIPYEPQREGVVYNVDMPRFVEEFQRLKAMYQDNITLRMGMEFGMQTHTIDQFEACFQTYEFDFILLSCHQVEDKEFWTQDFQKGRSQQEYNERYYEELYELVSNYKNYSVLGHLDLIRRYDEAGSYPFEQVKPWIEKILKQVIADGKGIELNTSSIRYGLDDLMPSRAILSLYRELGGRVITIGSDSHSPEQLGAHIAYGKTELKKLGFTTYCSFEGMKAIFHTL
ncbi:MAG: histidinol-phosphatase HisJ family protein [Erysipelotrichaceae bacterium]